MAKPKIPNQRNRYAKLRGRLNKYALAVQDIYDKLNKEAAKIAMGTGHAGGVFKFSDYPMTADAVNKLQGRFVREMRGLIYAGTSAEWKESNLVQDLLASRVLKTYGAQVGGKKTKVYYQENSDALKAFQERADKGMNLSTKLWNQSGNYKQELEYAISSAIEKGTSAVTLSKRLSKYLNDFPQLKADYKEKFGQAVNCHDCEYRSIRLARSEINMAYRTAEQKRWGQMDFVVGYEIKLSYSHEVHDTSEVCERMAGKYPKDFVFVGWHPNCMCYVIPILKTEDEFWADDQTTPSVNEVTDVPDGMKTWVAENQGRIAQAEVNGTLPYWYADNTKYVGNAQIAAESELVFASNDVFSIDFTDDELNMIKTGYIDKRSQLKMQERIFGDNGFEEDDIKVYRQLISNHRYGNASQEWADFVMRELFRDETSSIGSLLRLESQIEEKALDVYLKERGNITLYRAGTLERDSLSFTTRKGGITQMIEGEEVEWGYDVVTDVKKVLKDYHLVAGFVEGDIGYAGEEELFFISKQRKYESIEAANAKKAKIIAEEKERRISNMINDKYGEQIKTLMYAGDYNALDELHEIIKREEKLLESEAYSYTEDLFGRKVKKNKLKRNRNKK